MELEQNFNELGNPELASRFAESRGRDTELSREVMRRVLELAGCSDEAPQRLLTDDSGEKITDDHGEPIKVVDYLHEVAAVRHPAALFGILGFITTTEAERGSEEFQTQKETIIRMVNERTVENA